jgi:rhodanese-related sulfurtransferase
MEQNGKRPSLNLAHKTYGCAVSQALLIALLAVVIGFSLNQFRSDPLALKTDWSPEARLTSKFGRNILISMDEAKEKFISGSALFIDARSPEDYREGHIKGARNLTVTAFEEQAFDLLLDLPEDTLIVTYCDGEECALSIEVAEKLKEIGFENIRVLHNGWTVWKNHRLPSENVGEHGR